MIPITQTVYCFWLFFYPLKTVAVILCLVMEWENDPSLIGCASIGVGRSLTSGRPTLFFKNLLFLSRLISKTSISFSELPIRRVTNTNSRSTGIVCCRAFAAGAKACDPRLWARHETAIGQILQLGLAFVQTVCPSSIIA